MRLRSAWISDYKNLKDFTIEFDGQGFIDIFVGKNGSGKSNFLESLIEIFDHLFDFDADAPGPGFDYVLALEIDSRATQIQWRAGVLSVDGRARRTRGQMPLPENVIVYYSGQNRNVAGLVERYENRFRRRVRGSNLPSSPAFIGIGPEYKKLLILLLLLLPEDRRARLFLCEKLGILGTRGTVTLHLGRPGFAERKDFDHLDTKDLFWGLQGATQNFLVDLVSCIKGGATPGALHNREIDQYILPIDVALFRRVFHERSWHELFSLFNNLKILGMLSDIQMDVTLQGLELSDLGLFSDGQFQSVYLFAIAEVFKDRNCVTLLDEPDAFLHPEWQFDFLRQTEVISDAAARSNHILMSSHSAATLIPSIQAKVKFFDLKAGITKCYSMPKRVAIQKLSSNLIKYTEEEQLLSIVNAIQIEQKPVFFTEGSIDPIIIKEAWHRLYETELPFIPFFAFSCSYLKQLLQDDRIIGEMGGRPMFGLFDFDKAYDHWNGMNGEIIQPDWDAGRCKKLAGKQSYAFMLPVPRNTTIRRQVLAPSGDSFGGSALCEIEHLFYGDPRTAEFFETEPVPGGGERIILKSDAQKERFAKDVVPTLANEYFEAFRGMFDLVRALIQPIDQAA
ncbi:AAA family ATPase [Rhizobium laguerreae]|uniref:AAA family ATPase n=1 Tax=Rhizobium laguerreae TaxID=1076926 RepID=UPI001C917FB2|nr:AAA family ATPase [Rhizobium laguerreae]MBY3414844.1 AAA family ATPase [Rhizobium laguerreae]